MEECIIKCFVSNKQPEYNWINLQELLVSNFFKNALFFNWKTKYPLSYVQTLLACGIPHSFSGGSYGSSSKVIGNYHLNDRNTETHFSYSCFFLDWDDNPRKQESTSSNKCVCIVWHEWLKINRLIFYLKKSEQLSILRFENKLTEES